MLGDNKLPDLLAIGDSWFWYPFNNLLIPIWGLWAGAKTILAQGKVGAEATELASGNWLKDFRAALKGYDTVRGVLVSAGGNDFAGMDDMSRILKPDCSAAVAGIDCFDPVATEQLLFHDVVDAYGALLDEVKKHRPEALVFLHNYDYAVPTGIGVLGFGHWLKAPMDIVRVPIPVQATTSSTPSTTRSRRCRRTTRTTSSSSTRAARSPRPTGRTSCIRRPRASASW